MTPELVSDAINNISNFILRYAVTLAAVGALAMALIEAVKALFSLRDRFHKRVVTSWVTGTPVDRQRFAELGLPALPEEGVKDAIYRQLIVLTTGQTVSRTAMETSVEWKPWDIAAHNALFALELDRMMGQIQDAADAALSNPAVFPDLYLFLTAGVGTEDVVTWYGWASTPPVQSSEDRALAKRQADTYARLRQLIRRRLDALQLTAAYRWQTLNQFASVALGAVLLFVSLLWQGPQKASVWSMVVASVLGGFVAPVAKDLVIALKKVRSGG